MLALVLSTTWYWVVTPSKLGTKLHYHTYMPNYTHSLNRDPKRCYSSYSDSKCLL